MMKIHPAARSLFALVLLVAILVTASAFSTRVNADSPPSHVHILHTPDWYKEQRELAVPNAPTGSHDNLQYFGGPVMHTLTAYTIFWAPPGYSFPSSYRTLINRYFQDLGNSSFYNIVTQYYDNSGQGNILNTAGLGDTWLDSTNNFYHAGTPADPILDSDIIAEVQRALNTKNWPIGLNSMFFVFTPQGVESCYDGTHTSCTRNVQVPDPAHDHFCAYHGDFPRTGQNVIYANMPYGRTWGCNQFVYPSPNDLDADIEISIASHEQIEAVTDPLPCGVNSTNCLGQPSSIGWTDLNNDGTQYGEIGDKCAYSYGTGETNPDGINVILNHHPYILQMEWSNANNGCAERYPAAAFCYDVTGLATIGGAVTLSPPPNCGSKYSTGTTIKATANPSSGYILSYWSGAGTGSNSSVTFQVSGDSYIYGHFQNSNCYSLTTTVSPVAGGTVSKNPTNSTGCPSNSYKASTQVSLTANAAAGYQFFLWSGTSNNNINPTTIQIVGNTSVTANFNTTSGFPRPPTNLTSSPVSQNEINLSWTASPDAPHIDGYKIYRDGSFLATSNNPSFDDNGLACNTVYAYYVTTFQSNSESSASNSTQSLTQPCTNAIGIALCDGTNYSSPCQTFTYTSNDNCIYLDSMDNKSESITFKGSYIGNYNAVMYGDSACSVFNARYESDTPDFGLLDNNFSSMRIELRQPPDSCSTTPNPSSNQVILFADINYAGNCVTLNIGDYPNPDYLGYLGNDNAESLRVGGNVQALLCSDSGYVGTCVTITSDTSDLNSTSLGRNQLSSAKVQLTGCTYDANQIILYANTNFTGTCETLGIGDYPDPNSMGYQNDDAESIRVGSNIRAQLWSDSNYQGYFTSATGDVADLGTTPLGRNNLSSMKVQSCFYDSNQIVLFSDTNYGGSCRVLNVGDYPDPNSMNFQNDDAESIAVGANVQAVLWSDSSYAGYVTSTTIDVADLGNTPLGRNNLSSIKVQSCAYSNTQIVLYANTGFTGSCRVLSIGDYSNPDAMGYQNDEAESVRVGSSAKALMWSDDNYQGYFTTATSDISDLASTPLGRNNLSSIKVQMGDNTPTPTATPTYTPTSTRFPTYTPTNTPTNTPSATPTPTNTVLPTTVQDNNTAIQYDGWIGALNPNASGGTYRKDKTVNETMTFAFKAASAAAVICKGPDEGKVQVLLDGVSKGKFDLYAPSVQCNIKLKAYGGLVPTTKHKLVLKVTGAKNASSSDVYVSVDAFFAGSKRIEETDKSVQYNRWAGGASANANGGTFRQSSKAGALARLTFTGTSISWLTAKGTSYGMANVLIDGVPRGGTMDLFQPNTQWLPISYPNLGLGTHMIEIHPTGTKNPSSSKANVVVDGFNGPITTPTSGASLNLENNASAIQATLTTWLHRGWVVIKPLLADVGIE